MKIVIKATNLKLNQELRDYIEEKIGGLEKFAEVFQSEKYYDSFFTKGKPRAEVWLEIGRTTRHHQKGDIFLAEVQMRLPGKSLRVESEREDLKLAITEIKDDLQRGQAFAFQAFQGLVHRFYTCAVRLYLAF